MRYELSSLGVPYEKVPGIRLRVAVDATQTVPLRRVVSPPEARSGQIRVSLPVDPFDAAEGGIHHRCPSKLEQRIGELERELAAKSNANSSLADENAHLRRLGNQMDRALALHWSGTPDGSLTYRAAKDWRQATCPTDS